jgi:prefoldin beta subunit
MSQNQQIPPMVQELLAKFQQTQQNLQMILAQKQQLELEKLETEKALEE